MNGRRGAIVLQRPPTFLESLLQSAGIGISEGMQRYYRERERKRSVTQGILERVLTGEIPSELFATDLGQSFQRELGIAEEPTLKEITKTGLEKYSYPERTEELPGGAKITMPGVVPPEIPYESYRRGQEEVKEIEAQTKMRGELFVYEEKEKIKRRVERSFRMPLSKRVEVATDMLKTAKRNNVPVEDLTIRDPEIGININFLTYTEGLQKQKTEGIAKTKAGITYLKEELKFHSLLMDAEKFVSKLATAETMEPDEFESEFMKTEIGLWQQKELTPQQIRTQARRRLPIINQKILAQHKILRRHKFLAQDSDITLPFLKEFKLDEILNPEKYAGEFESIKAYTDLIRKSDREALRDVATKEAKLREALNMADTRHVVIPPEFPKQPTDSEIRESVDSIAQEIMKSWINPETNQPYTLEEAREHARNILKKE